MSTRVVRALLFTCLGSTLAGCGLFPPLTGTVRSLEGKVENGSYTAPDGSFSLQVPHQDNYELMWLFAKEQAGPDGFYVSFGPAAFDKTIYRCSVSPRASGASTGDLSATCHHLVDVTRPLLEPMTDTPLEVVSERGGDLDGKPAHFIRLKQEAPAGTVATRPAVIVHEACLVRHGDRFAFTWVQTYEGEGWVRRGIDADRFARSVVVLPDRDR